MDVTHQSFGNYDVLRLLAQGGQASIYLGEHRYLKRQAAIKVLHTSLKEKDIALFLSEAQILARLTHPHIVRVLDYAVEHDAPFLVMDYVSGGTVRARFSAQAPLSLQTTLAALKQVASALQYAHDQGVIHRDVKPENLLLDEQQRVMLSDFGIAMLLPSTDMLKTQEIKGTVAYMAPEQLRGKPCFASDQYALAVMAFEWLCGECPFKGTTVEIMTQHIMTPPPRICEKSPMLSQELDDVLQRALAKDPDHRFERVQDFVEAFERVCVGIAEEGGLSISSSVGKSSHEESNATLPIFDSAPPVPENGDRKREKAALRGGSGNRERILKKVEAFWIHGVLRQSLQGITPLALDLREQPDAVLKNWRNVLSRSEEPARSWSSATPITTIYDDVNGELLIMGEPGSGKTTLLLKLAQDLLTRAYQDEHHPIPVIFNLSSWSEKRQPIDKWMIEELNSRYQVPRKLGTAWVADEHILPLLDGLDEVDQTVQSACIEAINSYRRQHGLLPLVVCSRSDDYLTQPQRLLLTSAVAIQPLTLAQAEKYLLDADRNFESLCDLMRRDVELQEFINTPLTLNILLLAYQNKPINDLLAMSSLSQRQKHLFDMYVQRMLSRRGEKTAYSADKTVNWLGWLAYQLQQRNQMIFHLEQMQSDWLPDDHSRRRYHRWAVRLPSVLLGVLIGMFVGGMLVLGRLSIEDGGFLALSQTIWESGFLGGLLGFLFSRRETHDRRSLLDGRHWKWATTFGMVGGLLPLIAWSLLEILIFGSINFQGVDWMYFLLGQLLHIVSYGVVGFLVSAFAKPIPPLESSMNEESKGAKDQQRIYLRNALVCGIAGLLYGFFDLLGFSIGSDVIGYMAAQMLSFSTSFALVGLFVTVLIKRAGSLIRPSEITTWSWKKMARSLISIKTLLSALSIGAIWGITYGITAWLMANTDPFSGIALTYWFQLVGSVIWLVGLVSWILLALFAGFSNEQLSRQQATKPNEGIRRSALHAILFGLISWFIYGGITYLFRYLADFTPLTGFILPADWLSSWLIYGSLGAVVVALYSGGLTCIKHFILRFQLWRAGHIPWNYARFLDFATRNILLCKVGGGYIFVHRLLLNYFASRYEQQQASTENMQATDQQKAEQEAMVMPPMERR